MASPRKASKKATPKAIYVTAVIYEEDYPDVLKGDLCNVELLGWNKNYDEAMKQAKENAEESMGNLLVLTVEVQPDTRWVPNHEPSYTEDPLW